MPSSLQSVCPAATLQSPLDALQSDGSVEPQEEACHDQREEATEQCAQEALHQEEVREGNEDVLDSALDGRVAVPVVLGPEPDERDHDEGDHQTYVASSRADARDVDGQERELLGCFGHLSLQCSRDVSMNWTL